MASDTIQGRRSRASSTSQRMAHSRAGSKATIAVEPKSIHTSNEFLRDFLAPSFDPAAFLNAKLPPLAIKSSSSQTTVSSAVPLVELSKQANTLISQVDAHTSRLSDALTQLTDDILRNGSRLAYEVELLRGETRGLSEAFHDTLQGDIKVFLPEGLPKPGDFIREIEKKSNLEQNLDVAAQLAALNVDDDKNSSDPACIRQLQTLTVVRSRIENVVKTFGDAMDFSFPPSEVSVSSSFLSVSAPEPGSEKQSSEDKGQEVLKRLREEISGHLKGSKDPVEGIEAAANRVQELKDLAQVWKGTAEEKGRSQFIESLAKMVEDKHREVMKELDQTGKQNAKLNSKLQRMSGTSGSNTATNGSGNNSANTSVDDGKALPPGGFGLISQLQKLRGGL